MRIRIFDSAKLDLVDGFSFYAAQAIGVGHYFLDSLYSDIDSLALYAGIHRKKSKDFHWARGSDRQRGNIVVSPFGVHWPDLDEDLSIVGIARGDFGQHQRPNESA